MKRLALIFAALMCFAFFACNKTQEGGKAATFATWQEKSLIPQNALNVPVEQTLSKNDAPFAGIVSHHLLAYQFIDEWFETLAAANPNIKTFIILSPSHWNLSSADFSLTYGAWKCQNGFVQSDTATEKKLLESLGGRIEDIVFSYEHGVSTIAPFIERHFPAAKIAAVAYNGEPPVNTNMANKLKDAIAPFVGKKDFFILISSDFSHHNDAAGTLRNDNSSRKFFAAPSPSTWILAMCDNRPAIYALSYNMPQKSRAVIQRNTNSFVISGQDEDDITSYFFAFFVE